MVAMHGLLSLARTLVGGSVPAMLLVTVACGGSTAAPTPTAIPSPTPAQPSPTSTAIAGTTLSDADRRELEVIQTHMAEVRGLEPLAEVDIRLITREAAEMYFRKEIEEEAADYFTEAQPVYQLLGLISPGDDLMELELRLATSQVLGFYDTDEKAMFMVGQDHELDTLGVITVSHEFVHALQDQHFDLGALLEEAEDDWDTHLALVALVEGDATLAGMDYTRRFIAPADLLTIDFAEISRLTSEMESFPEALQQELVFPYEAGAGFARALFDDGGWAAINDAFDAPPTTTEQILHPEKYPVGEAGHEIALPDLTSDLGGRWRLEASNSLGEFLLTNHLDTQLSRTEAVNAAAGWGGDRWALYSDGDTGKLLLLAVEWDAPEELHQFFAAYLDWLTARSGGAWEPLGDDAALWEGARESVYVSRLDDRATIILSTDGEALEKVRHALKLP